MMEKSLPQPSANPGARPAKSRAFGIYPVLWVSAGAISLLYLLLVLVQPGLVAQYLGAGERAPDAASATQRALDATTAEVSTLRDTIDQFRNELIEMRAQISSQTDASRDLATRVSTLETVPADPDRLAKEAKAAAKAKAAEQAEAALKEKAAAAAAAKKLAAAKEKARELETGSVVPPGPTAPPIAFGPPTVTPANLPPPPPTSGPIGVQIATGPSLDSMRLNWTLLSQRHGDTFRSLEPRYTIQMSGSGETYNLIVGPLASVDDARRLCDELAAKATACAVSRFTGGAL